MTDIQYKTAHTACTIMEDTRNYSQRLLIPYDDFMDDAEKRTDFADDLTKAECNKAVAAIRRMDGSAAVFAEIYGTEGDVLTSDSLLVISSLSEEEAESAFENISDEYIAPSEINRLSGEDIKNTVVIGADGSNFPFECDTGRLLQLWWD